MIERRERERDVRDIYRESERERHRERVKLERKKIERRRRFFGKSLKPRNKA